MRSTVQLQYCVIVVRVHQSIRPPPLSLLHIFELFSFLEQDKVSALVLILVLVLALVLVHFVVEPRCSPLFPEAYEHTSQQYA